MKATAMKVKQHLGLICSMVESMLSLSGMMRGSFGTTHSRCGKPTCRCANPQEKGHPFAKLMWTDGTGPKTRVVKNEDTQTVLEAIDQYREFKRLRRNLREDSRLLEELLDAYEHETTIESRSRMGYHQST
jgi:hypothetical protein